MAHVAAELRNAEAVLAEAGVMEPRLEAASLLAYSIGRHKTFLIAHPEYVLKPEQHATFADVLRRRAGREPLQYITGRQEFYGLEFEVSPEVLIPRPETEMVVQSAIETLSSRSERNFCEVGIGSGCIAVSILFNSEGSTGTGLDISPPALRIAARNAAKHGVDRRLYLRESDVFSGLAGDEKFALIASNPPYVSETDIDGLQDEVRDFEPRIALTDEADGLSIIRRIVAGSPDHLSPPGFLLLEIGFNQSRAVRDMFHRDIWDFVEMLPDLQGIPRLVKARLR